MNSPSWKKLATPHALAKALALCNGLHPAECASLYIRTNPPLTYHCSLTEFLQWDIRAWASLGPEARHHGFWPDSSPGREELKDRRKEQWKNVPMNPLHNLPENLLNSWPVLTVFISLTHGTKKIKDRRTPTNLGNSYKSTQDSGAFRTHWEVATARVPQLHPLLLTCSWGLWGNKKLENVNELRFC